MRRIKGPGGLQKDAGSFGPVGPAHGNGAIPVLGVPPFHTHQPRVATDLTVLHETAMDVRLDEDFDFFAAVRAGHDKVGGIGAHGSVDGLRASGSRL